MADDPTIDPADAVDMEQVRAAVDLLDEQIVALIGERQRWVERAGELKRGRDARAVRAPGRVEAVVERTRALAVEHGASPDVVETTYRALIAAFVDLELGVHGAVDDVDPVAETAPAQASRPQFLSRAELSSIVAHGQADPGLTVAARDLRNHTADVLRQVSEGTEVTVTVNGTPMARIVPVVSARPQFLSRAELLHIMTHRQADPGLTAELDALSGDTTDDLDPL